ncbi:TonB-dependent receptor domain-containing protein [Allosphingosinicella deserti]|uniref:TonB-dependent receptor n=1 Tax=Allosphingosinicella deserti TaxID=2116704 RepID=A0A2P7QSS9_9SPHN|nr:TonB-dependent receptor [Sphingomonas deserti]PSJ41022.1 TonB-dependent receptor [Sphingomonas deserti]
MSNTLAATTMLLLSTALVAPAAALAQDAGAPSQAGPSVPDSTTSVPTNDAAEGAAPEQQATETPAEEQAPDVSIPGGDAEIVVVGTRSRDITRVTPQVVSVLSAADIARTGEGDIAGALSRVTGLSVVGNGFVYVRGLGDRYSLALLNGSPLPSPEPLRRVVPLDLFPTSVIASSLVQKSYSVNFPGEFGGGVINLTTRSVPTESFLTIGGAVEADSEATNQLGYTYYGSKSDWTGFDNGTRDIPPALASFLNSGERISEGGVDTQAIASELITSRNSILQRNKHLPANFSAQISGGTSFDLGGDARLGVIATAGYKNDWRTRDTIQQTAANVDLSQKELDFQRVITDNRIVVNGLLGVGLEFGDNAIRWTNLYIRDTLKQARLGVGSRQTTSPIATLQQQDTAWFERQLIDTQVVGEFKLSPAIDLDVRAGYANSQREAPFEISYEYFRSNRADDPYGQYFINRLNNGQQGNAEISFSDLNENLYSAGADLSYKATQGLTLSAGYAFSDTARRTERRDFLFIAPGTFPSGVAMFRPDYLLQPSVIDFYDIGLVDTNEGNPVFDAKLRNHAVYGQIQAQFSDELSLNYGIRWEKADQTVDPVQVFNTPTASLAGTSLKRDYFLPAATLTWQFRPDMQIRVSGSKTIARPQFRELIYQLYFDPDTNREFRGNPLLVDSQLYNAEARYEYYFARDQRFSLSGFYKRIDNPIETFASFSDNSVLSSFANAPQATLYGAEVESQKYFDLSGLSDGAFWQSRRAVLIANYTYSKSKVKVNEDDTVAVFASSATKATDLFRDGTPLTGQSDHLVNLQFGLEDTDRLSQQTLLLTYASKRVTNRGAALQPDIIEYPGLRLDFVARQGINIGGVELEAKFEVRNITGTKYKEYQQSGENRIYYNLYKIGTTASFGVSATF